MGRGRCSRATLHVALWQRVVSILRRVPRAACRVPRAPRPLRSDAALGTCLLAQQLRAK
jgi:hypothetical protein